MAKDINYTNFERPYDYYLDRGSNDNIPVYNPNGNTENKPVRADGSMGDVWIDTFIASKNWKPKKFGFYIDGATGYAEFQNVYVVGNINASIGNIGGFVIGYDYIRDLADSFGLASTVTGGNDIRFWAGTTFENRYLVYPNPDAPPFAVYEDGTAHIGGFNIGLDSFISDLGNVELNQANDTILVGNLTTPGRRVVLDGQTGSILFYNNSDPTHPIGQILGGEPTTTPGNVHDDFQIINPNTSLNLGDITIWPGGIRTFGFSSNGFGDIAMLHPGSTFFPSPPTVGGGPTSDLGSPSSPDTFWNTAYIKSLGDSTHQTTVVYTMQLGDPTHLVSDSYLNRVNTNQITGPGGLGTTNIKANAIEATQITGPGGSPNKVNILANVVACPLPTFEDALSIIRRIPNPILVGERGHFGENRLYIDDLTFPDEALFTMNGKREIEHTNMIGLLMQAVRQLTKKVDDLERVISSKVNSPMV